MSSSRRNPNIKKANTEIEITQDQINEFIKCSRDPVYFIRNYVKIQHPTRGAIKFELYDYQEEMIRAFQENRYNICLLSRQSGKCNFFNTMINIIERPRGLKKFILFLFNRKFYNELFNIK